jgi:hypothetical protein
MRNIVVVVVSRSKCSQRKDRMKIIRVRKTTRADVVEWMHNYFKGVEIPISDFEKIEDNEVHWEFLWHGKPYYILIDENRIMLLFHVGEIPTDLILPFYRRCLELNTELLMASINVFDTSVRLVLLSPVEHLEEKELHLFLESHMDMAQYVLEELSKDFEMNDVAE